MADDVLTFEELRQVQSQERDSDTLQALDEAFFDRAQNYLELKKDGDDHLQNQEYRNARNILEDILDLRQKKIVKLAFLSVKSGVTVDNMLPHEEELFEDVKELIADYRGRRHDTVFDSNADATSEGVDEPVAPDDTGEPVETDEEEPATGTGDDLVEDTVEGVELSEEEDAAEDAEEGLEEDINEPDEEGETVDEAGEQDDVSDGDRGDDGSSAADDILQLDDGDDETEDVQDDSDPDTGTTADEEGDEDDEETILAGSDTDASGDEDDGRVTVQVQERVPEFMGTDLEAYGPFEEGDEVDVPAENADVLVQQGKAERT